MSSDNLDRTALTRRTLIGGAGVVAAGAALTACGSSGDTGEARSAVPAPTTTAPPGPDAEVVAAVADVPVGGGVMLESKRLVVTQPAEGDFRAFIAICTHQGCNLSGVEGERIICPCHGSRYDLDGAPVEGPAKRPLKTRPVAARGSDLVVG